MKRIYLCSDCLSQGIRKITGCEDDKGKRECLWCSEDQKENCPQKNTLISPVPNPALRCDPCNEIRSVW